MCIGLKWSTDRRVWAQPLACPLPRYPSDRVQLAGRGGLDHDEKGGASHCQPALALPAVLPTTYPYYPV